MTRRDGNNDAVLITDKDLSLDAIAHRGPLLKTALALFGTLSSIERRMTRPEAYLFSALIREESKAQPNPFVCVGEVLFIDLLSADTGAAQTGGVLGSGCLTQDFHNQGHL